MKILIVIPSFPEYTGICKTFFQVKSLNRHLFRAFDRNLMMDILVPGAGAPAMIYHLTRRLSATHYDMAVLAGICGAYDHQLHNGTVVRIDADRFANFGAESPEGFLPAENLNFVDEEDKWAAGWIEDRAGWLLPHLEHIPGVRGITVEASSGTNETIKALTGRYAPATESMEGAAFFYVCRNENLNFVQLRGISNRVEPRNRDKWEVKLALDNLAVELKKLIQRIDE